MTPSRIPGGHVQAGRGVAPQAGAGSDTELRFAMARDGRVTQCTEMAGITRLRGWQIHRFSFMLRGDAGRGPASSVCPLEYRWDPRSCRSSPVAMSRDITNTVGVTTSP